MTVTRPAPRPESDTPSGGTGDDTMVLAIAAGTGPRAQLAALAAARLLGATAGTVVPTDAAAPGLEGLLERAAGVYVLDPGRLSAWRHRRGDGPDRQAPDRQALARQAPDRQAPDRQAPDRQALARQALSAPAAARDRLALLGLLSDRPRRVRWITRPGQLLQLAGEGRL